MDMLNVIFHVFGAFGNSTNRIRISVGSPFLFMKNRYVVRKRLVLAPL